MGIDTCSTQQRQPSMPACFFPFFLPFPTYEVRPSVIISQIESIQSSLNQSQPNPRVEAVHSLHAARIHESICVQSGASLRWSGLSETTLPCLRLSPFTTEPHSGLRFALREPLSTEHWAGEV